MFAEQRVPSLPLYTCSIFSGPSRSPIVYGFEGLLRIAGRFVGMGQAVEVVGGRWGQEMFCKCGAEERTSSNRPVFCAI